MKLVLATAFAFSTFGALPALGQSLEDRSTVGENFAKEQIRLAILAEKHIKFPTNTPLLATKDIAIAVAEPILFSIYGKDNILRERPYEIYLVDGFWYITGTMKNYKKGGTFEIIMEANTSRVIDVSHGK